MRAILSIALIILTAILTSCATYTPKIAPDLFKQTQEFKFTPAENEGDILRNYLDLYRVYQDNLLLLQLVEKLNAE